MTWPREQGHISRTKGHRPLKFSENFKKGLKSSYSKNQISSFKNRGYRAQNLPGGGCHPPPPMCGRGLKKNWGVDESSPLSLIRLNPTKPVVEQEIFWTISNRPKRRNRTVKMTRTFQNTSPHIDHAKRVIFGQWLQMTSDDLNVWRFIYGA